MCFGGGSTTVKNETKLPQFITDFGTENVDIARLLSQIPYQPYDAPRVAPFTPDQLQSFDTLRGFAPKMAHASMEGLNAAGAPARQYNGPDSILDFNIDDYMNPYLNNVVGRSNNEIMRTAGIQHQDIDSGANMAGAFGDARHGIADAELDRNTQRTIADNTQRGYSGAFDNAQAQEAGDLQRALGIFDENSRLYEAGLGRKMQGPANSLNQMLDLTKGMYGTGLDQQAQTQRSLDLGYQDFKDQINYPWQILDRRSSLLGATPRGQTTSSSQPTPSPFSQILGTVGGIASLFI